MVRIEIRSIEQSKRRIWRQRADARLKILADFERVLRLSRHHKKLSDFFVKKHRKMEKMIANLK